MNTKLELTIKNTEQRCKLTDLDFNVNITGFLSKTSVTMTFLNETDLDSEGELVFPMPEGAAISGYAVDINGELVDGVVVEKEKARITFEAEARSVEKPSASIVEHVVGNVFRTRITPLPKKATRIIRVAYVEELTPISKSQQNRSANKNQRDVQWKMSLENIGPLKTLTMNAVIAGGGAPRARFDGNTIGTIKPLPDVIGPVAWRFKSENCTIKHGFEIDVPGVASQIVEVDEDKQQYFVLNDDFSAEFNFNESVVQADRVALLWDASKSREVRNEKDVQLIKTYVQKLSNITIDLIVFRDTSEDLVTFKLVNGNASPLIEYLNKIPYIGGSNLGQLSVTKTVPIQIKDGEEIVIRDTYNYYLMFTDGLHNLSLNTVPEKLEAPVYIFSSSTLSDGTLLKVWARKSGGEYFDLNSTSSSTSEIVSKLGNTKFQYLFAEIDGAVVSEIYPSLPSPIQGKQFTIAGKINGQNPATIALNYGYGTRVTRRMKFQINPASALKNNLAARYWAQKKIDELQLFPEVAENEAKILSIGQQYNIVTPNSSLIVLESLDQYVKYEIEPPKSLPDVRKNYLEIMKNRKQQQLERDNEKILSVVSFWQRRVAWWNEDVTSPEHSEPQIQHHFQYGFFKPDVHQVAPKDVLDLKQADLNDVLQLKIVEDEEETKRKTLEKQKFEEEMRRKALEKQKYEEEMRREALEKQKFEEETQRKALERQKYEEDVRRKVLEEQEMRHLETATITNGKAMQLFETGEQDIITKRDDEIKLIEQELQELNDIFRDVGKLVNDQSQSIERIESNVGSVDPWNVDDDIDQLLNSLTTDAPQRPVDTSLYSELNVELAKDLFDEFLPAAAATPPMSPVGGKREYTKSEISEDEDEDFGGGLFADDDGDGDGGGGGMPLNYKSMQFSPHLDAIPSSSSPNLLFDFDEPAIPAQATSSSAYEDISSFDPAFTASDPFDDIREQMDDGEFAGFTYVPESKPAPKLEPDPVAERQISKNELKKKAKDLATGKKKEEKANEKASKAAVRGKVSVNMQDKEKEESKSKTNSFVNKLFAKKEAPEPDKPVLRSSLKELSSTETKSTTMISTAKPVVSDKPTAAPKAPLGKAKPVESNRPAAAPKPLPSQSVTLAGQTQPPLAPIQPGYGGLPMPPQAAQSYPSAAPAPYPMAQPFLAPSAAPSVYPSVPASSVMPISTPVLEESDRERSRTISTRASRSQLDSIQKKMEESESISREVMKSLDSQAALLDTIEDNIRGGGERVSLANTELKQAAEYQKKSWFSGLKNITIGADIGLLGRRSKRRAEDVQTTIPTIGFNSEPASEKRLRRNTSARIQKDIDEVKEAMNQNIDRVLSRGDQIEQLVSKTDDLQYHAQRFHKSARKMKSSACGCGPGIFLIFLMPIIFLVKFVVWALVRVKRVLNNSVPEYEPMYLGTTMDIANYVPLTKNTVTEPVYFTPTLPAVQVEIPSDEYFSTLLKAQDEVQTQLNTAAAPEPETDTTVNKTEKVDPKMAWVNWHARQAQTWKEFEQKHFTTGLCFMQKWNEVRVGQLQRVLERELKRVDEEFNSTKTDLAFYKGDERKTASMEVRQKWKSKEFYMSAIETLDNTAEDYQIHAQILNIQKREHVHEKLSSFYIDAAQFLFGRGRIHEGATTLSTLAEIDFENPQLLRAMAMNTDHIPQLDHMTEALYRQILKLRPDEPQSYTDLAAVLARRIFRTIKGNTATSTRDSKLLATANEAMELYKQVIIKKWDVRWCQVELTALSEMSRLGHFVQWMGLDQSSMVNIDRRLVQSLMDLDLHVMIRWDTDLTDAEIVVTEPSGEVCNSFHNKTKTGMLSRNFTCGYGPQEYCVRTAQPGRYRIEVRLFGAPPAAPPTTVTVRVTTDWGRPVTQVEEYHVIRLSKVKEAVHVMDVNFKEL